jgi:erythromycin esterase-like protein
VLATACSPARRRTRLASPAVRVDPISAIIDAFAMHPVVALGEGPHGNEQGHAFRLALIRDPRFAARVNDIVIESGSARYQD